MDKEHVQWLVDTIKHTMDAIIATEDEIDITDVKNALMYASMKYYIELCEANGCGFDNYEQAAESLSETLHSLYEK